MSGRNCAYGLYFQYLVSLGFLLDVIDRGDGVRLRVDPSDSGDNGRDRSLQIVDVDLERSDGDRAVVVQVKGSIDPETASPITAPELADLFRQLVASGQSQSYQVVTNRRLTEPAQRIADALNNGDMAALVLAWPSTDVAELHDNRLSTSLLKCHVVTEHRSSAELLSVLRARIKALRIRSRAGTGEESAGLLTIYLIGQLLYHGAGDHPELISVEQAQKWLQTTPEDLAKYIGRYDWGIPVGVPFPGITVRTSKLRELVELVERPQTDRRASRLFVVHGLSGQGKSTLSAQFASDYADHYDFMWWVDCESESSIAQSLRLLEAQIPRLEWGPEGASLGDLSAVLSKFPGRWLIIADNVYDGSVVAPWLPTTGFGDIIVTTVDSTVMPSITQRVDLKDGFTAEESRGFLCDKLPGLRAHTDLLDDLAETLAHWPLALSMAATYLMNAQRDLRQTPRHHLEQFRSAVIRTTTAVDDRRYPRTLAAAISLVLRQVKDRAAAHPFIEGHDVGEMAINALVSAAYFGEADIPAEILWPSVSIRDAREDARASIVSDAIITLLRSGSLVHRTQLVHERANDNPFSDRITINRITQGVIRSEIEAENPVAIAQFLIELCGRVDRVLRPAIDSDKFDIMAALSNHAEHIVRHGKRLEAVSTQLAASHSNLALVFEKFGRYPEEIVLLEDQLAILKEIGDNPSLLKIQTLVQLSNVLIESGRPFEQIIQRITEAVEVAECFEPMNPDAREALGLYWVNLQRMAAGLHKNKFDPRVIAIRIRVAKGIAPPTAASMAAMVDCIAEADELARLMGYEGYEREVIRRARVALSKDIRRDVKIKLLGLQIEAHAHLRDALSTMNGIRELELLAQPLNVDIEQVVNTLQNVGLAVVPNIDTDIEYVHILRVLLHQSEERMQLAPANPNLQWFHHVLSSFYLIYIGDSVAAQPHLSIAHGYRPDDQRIHNLADWEMILSTASERALPGC